MKIKPAPFALVAGVLFASAGACHARTVPIEGLTCLYQLAKPLREEGVIRFAFSPLADRLATHFLSRASTPSDLGTEQQSSEEEEARTAFTARFVSPQLQAPQVEPMDHWPVFDSLRKWQNNPYVQGLSQPLTNPQSFIALGYTDIFETGRAAYKGGHGVGLFFGRAF